MDQLNCPKTYPHVHHSLVVSKKGKNWRGVVFRRGLGGAHGHFNIYCSTLPQIKAIPAFEGWQDWHALHTCMMSIILHGSPPKGTPGMACSHLQLWSNYLMRITLCVGSQRSMTMHNHFKHVPQWEHLYEVVWKAFIDIGGGTPGALGLNPPQFLMMLYYLQWMSTICTHASIPRSDMFQIIFDEMNQHSHLFPFSYYILSMWSIIISSLLYWSFNKFKVQQRVCFMFSFVTANTQLDNTASP